MTRNAVFRASSSPPCRCRWRAARGFSLMEVVLALFIFLMMSLMFSAVVPAAARTAKYANSYSYAAALCQRKVDQIQEAGWDKIQPATGEVSLRALGIIDDNAAAVGGNVAVYSFTQNDTATNAAGNPDNLSQYFPGGANPATRPTGTIRIEPWEHSYRTIGGNSVDTLKKVTVTISWRDARSGPSSFSMTTLVTRMPTN